MTTKHAHAEAFALMKYRCEMCGRWEWIWNSRDGVTPYIVRSRCCPDESSVHVLWSDDEYRPDYELQPGQRFFRDGTCWEAIRLMTERLERFAEQGHVAPPDVRAACLDAAANGRDEFRDGWPYVDTIPEAQKGEQR